MTIAQVWITAPGQVEVRHVEPPVPGPGEVAIHTARAGICGSDLHTYREGHVWLPYPIPPGHEVSGVVAAVGREVTALRVGDRVFINPALTCGSCLYCLTGQGNLCERLVGIGAHRPGGMADLFVVPEQAAWAVPAGMSLLEASLVEPLATGVHAARLAGGVQGKAVVILGGGTIGLCVLAVCLAHGAAVVVSEPVASKRQVALCWGASGAVDARDEQGIAACLAALPHRPDVVFDCVGRPVTVALALRLAIRAGRVVVVGAEHGTVPLSLQIVQDYEVHILGSSMYVESDLAEALDLAQHGAEQITECVTAEYPLARAPEAFERAASGSEIKVQLLGEPL